MAAESQPFIVWGDDFLTSSPAGRSIAGCPTGGTPPGRGRVGGFLARADGDHQIGESFLTVSLGEPHGGYCHKLIAAIMERAGGPTP
jgi:hypothetical protein